MLGPTKEKAESIQTAWKAIAIATRSPVRQWAGLGATANK